MEHLAIAEHWSQYDGAWPWPNFTPREMADRKTGELYLDIAFMNWLQDLRQLYGRPMIISSGYRTSTHQKTLPGGRSTGSHVDGMAADIGVYGEHAWELQKMAYAMDVLGVGVSQTGNYRSRYLHLDRWTTAPEGTRPNCWSY